MEAAVEELKKDLKKGSKHSGEDVVTSSIEKVSSKVPSGAFLALGIGCVAASAGLALMGRTKQANFVGLWVPTILLMGIYNKLVKIHEKD